jgi:hypothetical protein
LQGELQSLGARSGPGLWKSFPLNGPCILLCNMSLH